MSAPVLFISDYDGVLVDSEKDNFNVVEQIVSRFGINLTPKDWWQNCYGENLNGIDDYFRSSFNQYEISKEDFLLEAKAGFVKNSFNMNARRVLVPAFQAFYEETGIKTPIASNNINGAVRNSLLNSELSQYIGKVFAAEDFEQNNIPLKPEPDPWWYVAKENEIDKNKMGQVVVIEDSPIGCLSAKAAGAFVVQIAKHSLSDHVQPKDPNADIYLNDLDKQLPVLTDMVKRKVPMSQWSSKLNPSP